MRTNPTAPAEKSSAGDDAGRNLVSISPFFIVKDLQASVSYYIERLGFRLDFAGPDGEPYYSRVSRDGIGIMLKAVAPDVAPQPTIPGTSGPAGMPASTRGIRTRSSMSSAVAAPPS
jgi:hypothetical protein